MPITVPPRAPAVPELNALRGVDPHLYESFKKFYDWAQQMSQWAANLQITSVNPVPVPPVPGAAPTVTAIAPPNGPAAGGTAVTITGTGFQFGATATIGGVAIVSPVAVSPTTLTGTTGAHASGAVDVVVTNPDAQGGTLAAAFTYISPVVAYILTQTLGTLRNDIDRYGGFSFATDANAPTVTALGRWKVAGSTQTHNVFLFQYVDGVGGDVQIATVAVDTTLGADGDYQYVDLGAPVTLLAGTSYYVVSEEFAAGDQWYDGDTTLDSFTFGTLGSGAFSTVLGSVDFDAPACSFVPVNFKVQL